MWQVAHVGTGMSAGVRRAGRASRFIDGRSALKMTPCFDSV